MEVLEMERAYYFAYGSNMDDEQMQYRCPDAVKVGRALLPCFRFAIDTARVATVVNAPTEYVEGILWKISSEDERSLDVYEGVRSGCYSKQYLSVCMKDGSLIEPLVYVSNRPEWDRPTVTASSYMNRILECAEENGFSDDYVARLTQYARS